MKINYIFICSASLALLSHFHFKQLDPAVQIDSCPLNFTFQQVKGQIQVHLPNIERFYQRLSQYCKFVKFHALWEQCAPAQIMMTLSRLGFPVVTQEPIFSSPIQIQQCVCGKGGGGWHILQEGARRRNGSDI